MNQCKGHHGYKTAEITLLCHKVLCFYRAAALLAMQSAVSVCLSVRPSVTRWYPIQTNEHRITWSSL